MIEPNSQNPLENDAPAANQAALLCSPAALVSSLQIPGARSRLKVRVGATRFGQNTDAVCMLTA